MAHITREDGVNFVIPSYRDVLTVKSKKKFQTDLLALGKRYGDYLAIQRKSATQYDVAFSTDTGYLLGETVWQHFNRPIDMIYCEALPNSLEVILVIVKGGNVYLDGSFPADSIQDELLIFLTQQNEFEIYTFGNVPISETPQDGKFSFDSGSVKAFKVLTESAFSSLPLINNFQLKLIETTLAEHGIGSFPIKQVAAKVLPFAIIFAIVVGYFLFKPEPLEAEMEPNPYQTYVEQMESPFPDKLIEAFVEKLELLYTVPGWYVSNIKYQGGGIVAAMKSSGASIESLMAWSDGHGMTTNINSDGVFVSSAIQVTLRPKPREVYPVKQTLAIFVDRLVKVYPGNNVSLEMNSAPAPVSSYSMKVSIKQLAPEILLLVGQQTKGLPLILDEISLRSQNALLDGTITLKAIGK